MEEKGLNFIQVLGKDKVLAYLFLMPAILLLGIFTLYPILYAGVISFFDFKLGGEAIKFIGMRNYSTLIQEERFFTALKNSLLFTGVAVPLELLFGLGVALLIHRDFFGAKVVRALVLIPMMVASAAVAVMFMMIYHEQYGIANYLLQLLPVFKPIGWLSDKRYALFSIILCDVWQWTPVIIILLLAGLDSLPVEPFESAVIDGANRWEIFRFLTLPLLKKIILVALALRLIMSLRVFDKVFVLTMGGPGTSTEVLNLLGYEKAFVHFQIGEAAALVIVIIALTSLIVIPIFTRAYGK